MPASKVARDFTSDEQAFKPTVFELVTELCSLTKALEQEGAAMPCLAVGARSKLWDAHDDALAASRDRALELSKSLCQLLQGPHEYFHDLVSSNWDLGALYTIIEFDILGKIPLDGLASAHQLAEQVGLDERKLLRILRLATCSNILYEAETGVFGHTALSEELLHDDKFRAFIGFQLYETRIGSANLADSLKGTPNTFENGQSAFRYALGIPLYQWHAENEKKGARFRMAMQSVSKTLDPGDDLFRKWFEDQPKVDKTLTVVDVLGGNRPSQQTFVDAFPHYKFVTAANSDDLDAFEGPILAYIVRNVFWNKTDDEVIQVVEKVHQAMKRSPGVALLVNEMLSPSRGDFTGAFEHAYRRRDVTTMTMHNAKQRTSAEWRALFAKVNPEWRVQLATGHSSHSYRGLWEIRLSC